MGDFLVGTTISHYKVLEKIGEGGMGEVFLAQDTTLDRKVALKFLPEEMQQDSTAKKRFLREAKSAAALDHPYICHIHEVGEVEGKSFIAMEYVQGETLQDKLSKGPLPLKDALEKATEVAEALEEAHNQGIVHRDLKPSNIMLTPQGHVKVMDFGLAKRVTPVEGQGQEITTALTKQGSTLGTVPYMSPEQVRGQEVDTRSDIFSFGVVLYEMLTGVNPFKGDTSADTSHAILGETPSPLTRYTENIPVLLQHTVRKMLAKEPDDRYQLIHDVRTDLGELREDSGDSIRGMTTGVPSTGGWKRAIPWVVAAVFATVAVVAIWRPADQEARPATKLAVVPLPTAPLGNTMHNDLAVSPDGRQIVYVSGIEGTTQLYLRTLGDLEAKPISGSEGAVNPFFSPDGEWVAFSTAKELKRVPLQGGTPVKLSDLPSGISYASGSWGPSDTIVFSESGFISGASIYRISARGGEAELLASPDGDEGENLYRFPQILPGGRAVLFSVLGSGSYKIVVLSLETGEQKDVLEGGRQPRYLPTGHLVYEQPLTGTLLAIPFDLDRLETTGDSVPVLEGVRYNPTGAVDYSISSEGTLVYVPRRTDRQQLVWVNRNGTEDVAAQEERSFAMPRISPDGKQAAVIVYEDDGSRNVWIYNFEDSSFRRLTFEGEFNTTPAWTPDGKWVTFQGGRAGQRGLFRKLADGTGLAEPLTTPTPGAQIPYSWLPDGLELALSYGSGISILSMDSDKEPRPFITSGNAPCCAAFSPDGERLAYVVEEAGRLHVFVSPYANPQVKVQISEEEGGTQPVWSPDGTELFYRSGEKMMVVSLQAERAFSVGKPRVLFEGVYFSSDFIPGTQYYDISPDGERFLMIRERKEAQINVVLNWFEELKRLVPTP